MQLVPQSWLIWYKSVNEQLRRELDATMAENQELTASLVEFHQDNGELLSCCERLMRKIREKNEECELLKKKVVAKITVDEEEMISLGGSQSGLHEEKCSFHAQDDLKGRIVIPDGGKCSPCDAAEREKQRVSNYLNEDVQKVQEENRRMKQRIASLIREDKINQKKIEDLKRRCCKLGKMFAKVRRKNLKNKKKLRQCKIKRSVFECFHKNEKKVNEQLIITVEDLRGHKSELRQRNEILKAELQQTEQKLPLLKKFITDLSKEKEALAKTVEKMKQDSVLVEDHVDLLLVRIAEISEDKLKYARQNEKMKAELEYAEEQVDLLNKYIDQEENRLKMTRMIISEPRLKWWKRMVCFRD